MDAVQHFGQRKAEVRRALHTNHARPGCARVDLVHAERGRHYQHFVQRLEIGFAQQMNGFVHSVGEQDLLGNETKMGSDNRFHRPAFGIARQVICRDLS